jgi:hypothetical protein
MEAHKKEQIALPIAVIPFNGRHDIIGCRVSYLKLAGFERLDHEIRTRSVSHFHFQAVLGKNPVLHRRMYGQVVCRSKLDKSELI